MVGTRCENPTISY